MIKLLVNEEVNDTGITVAEATQEAKNLFKSNNKPFTLKDTVEGPNTKVVFSEHFIMVMRDADSNECMARMSQKEKELYWDYMMYQESVIEAMDEYPDLVDEELDEEISIIYYNKESNGTPEQVVRALSDWAMYEVLEYDENMCYGVVHKIEE